jgi:hypothetical protein
MGWLYSGDLGPDPGDGAGFWEDYFELLSKYEPRMVAVVNTALRNLKNKGVVTSVRIRSSRQDPDTWMTFHSIVFWKINPELIQTRRHHRRAHARAA